MGHRLPYPNVDPPQIYQIYKQSQHKLIYAYGLFVKPLASWRKRHPPESFSSQEERLGSIQDHWTVVRSELCVAGLDEMALVWYPVPARYREEDESDGASGWLVVLGTGFDKVLHVPVSLELVERVQDILRSEEEPAWWRMDSFDYPPPKLWIKFRNGATQQ